MSYINNNNFGSHIQYQGSITKTLQNSLKLGQNAFQFFLGNPLSLKRSTISEKDVVSFQKVLEEVDIEVAVFSHFPYAVNLCGSTTCLAWNGNNEQDEKTDKSIACIQHELHELNKINGNGVVIHVGSFKDKNKGCSTVAESINKINFPDHTKLLIECMAAQGTVLCSTFEEMRKIRDLITEEKRNSIGFCIDTAHIFGAGLYDLGKIEEIDKMFVDIESILGIENVKLFHINDSLAALGSRKDKHALIGEGLIWKDNLDSFKHLLLRMAVHKIPGVLETDPSDFSKVIDIMRK